MRIFIVLADLDRASKPGEHALIALNGPQTNSSSVEGGLMMAKTATEPNSYRGNLRSGEFHELGPIGLTMEASVSPRPLLVILAEHTGLIAKKSPPQLCWPSACYRQVARHGGLGDAEAEHQKLTMDPWRTPEKVLTGHLGNQIADLTGNPVTPTSPATTRSIPRNRGPAVTVPAQDGFRLDDHQALTPFRPPTRQQHRKQPIKATEARATSSTALQHRNLMAQRDRFRQQRSAGSWFASGDRGRSACRHPHECRLSPALRNHQ
jgi:hypothetical protein